MRETRTKRTARFLTVACLLALPACSETGGSLQLFQTAQSGSTPAAKAPLSDYLNIKAPVGGQLSPEGDLYYVNRAGKAYQLFRRPSEPGSIAKQLTDFEDGIAGFSLSPDGKNVIITASVGGDEQNDLYLMPTNTCQIGSLLVDRKVVFGSVLWKRDSSGFAYRANDKASRDFYVYGYELASATPKLIYQDEGSNYPADWSRDGSKLLVGKYNSNNYQQIFEVTTALGSAREITPQGVQRQFAVIGYNADETRVFVSTDYLGNFNNIATLDIDTGDVVPFLTEFAYHDLDDAAVNEERTIIAAVINDNGYGRLVVRRLADGRNIPSPRLGKGLFSGLRFTQDTLQFSFHNAQTPGIIHSWNVKQPRRAPLPLTAPENAGINLNTFVLPKLVRYKSFDGKQIPAFLYLPRKHRFGQPVPFIVSFHGGPEAQARPRMSVVHQYFLSRGFGILQPNVRGSAGYGTEYMNLDNYKNRMDSVKDGIAAANWLIDKGYTKKGQIGAYGGSYGGFMVMAAITEAPELFAAACDVVGIVNFETFLKNTKDYRRHLREAEYGPLSDPEFLRSVSPIHKVDRIQTPLLVVHGKNDPRVPVGEARQIVAALKDRGQVVESLIFDDEGHGIRKQPNRIVFYEALVRFFDQHLRSGPSAGSISG